MALVSIALILLTCLHVISAQNFWDREAPRNHLAKGVVYNAGFVSPFHGQLAGRQSGCDTGYSPCSDGVSCCPTGDTCTTNACCAPGDSPCPDGSGCCATGVTCLPGGFCNTTCGANSIICGIDGCCDAGYDCVYPQTPSCLESPGATNPVVLTTPAQSTPAVIIPASIPPQASGPKSSAPASIPGNAAQSSSLAASQLHPVVSSTPVAAASTSAVPPPAATTANVTPLKSSGSSIADRAVITTLLSLLFVVAMW